MSRRSRVAVASWRSRDRDPFGVTDILNGVLADPRSPAITGMTPAEVAATEPTGYRLYDFAARTQGLA